MKVTISQPEICDEYLGTAITSLSEIFDTLTKLKSEFLDHRVIVTLDDLGQAQYTSMHGIMSHDLDETQGYDLSKVDPVAFEDGEHIGSLTTKSEFFIRRNNFLLKTKSLNFADVCCDKLTIDDHEIEVLKKIHASPIDYIDSEVLFKVVPVQTSSLAISAFPNGYFTCDLNPFENYALAKHLEQNYGYELFGIGASLVGFKRNNQLDSSLANSLAKDIANLYNRENDQSVIEHILELTKNYNYLFLKYVEYLEY
ncbi:hypothetical protein QVK62_004139 [Vibrio parahaemolyticus]|nr:hypothetical protein [Vibrio parahaemolyticus]